MMESDRSAPVISIDEVLSRTAITIDSESLKPQQLAVIKAFVSGQDIFAALPTIGYGVSLFCNSSPGVQNPSWLLENLHVCLGLLRGVFENVGDERSSTCKCNGIHHKASH